MTGVARIMLVEDNPGDVFLLEKALKGREIAYELTCYEDGEQAIRALSQEDAALPDLILLDLHLPRADGFDVLRTVRREPRLVGIPVGILTSSNMGSDRHRLALLGADRYIKKPASLEEFIEQIGAAVREMLNLT